MRQRTECRRKTQGCRFDLVTRSGKQTAVRADVLCAQLGVPHLGMPHLQAHLVQVFVPPLVRDRKTLRAMARETERPTFAAGTRAWHKRPLRTIMGQIDHETVMARTRLAAQRQEAVARLRTIPKPTLRRFMRVAQEWARDTERDNDHDKTRTWRDYYPVCLHELITGDSVGWNSV